MIVLLENYSILISGYASLGSHGRPVLDYDICECLFGQ